MLKMHLHGDRTFLSLQQCTGLSSHIICYFISGDHGVLRSVFQQLRIHFTLHCASRRCRCCGDLLIRKEAMIVRSRYVLTYQHLFISIDHFLGGAFSKLHALVQQYNPVAVFTDAA